MMTYWEALRATFGNLDQVGKHYAEHGVDKEAKARCRVDVGALKKLQSATQPDSPTAVTEPATRLKSE